MPKVEYRPLNPESSNAQDVKQYVQEILQEREDQASFAVDSHTFEYLGIVNNLDALLQQFKTVIEQSKKSAPQSTFVLEYHHSCVNHSDTGFHLFTFTLSVQEPKNKNDRHYQIITWKADVQNSYQNAEKKIREFMRQNTVQDLPPASGVVSSLDPES